MKMHYNTIISMVSPTPFLRNGKILMLALDHRGSLAKMIPANIIGGERIQTMTYIKQALLAALSSMASGVLLDAKYGLAAYKNYQSENPKKTPLPYLLCIEKSGYSDINHERVTQLEYSVLKLKEMGALGVKLLLFFHPDARGANQQIATAKKVYDDCQKKELPFFLEILNYDLENNPYDPTIMVPASVEIFLGEGINASVFKLEFPGTAASCKRITELLGKTPWILLTKGEKYEKFIEGLKIAVASGAWGFLAGRSLWKDFALLPKAKWEEFFKTIVRQRFEEIVKIAN